MTWDTDRDPIQCGYLNQYPIAVIKAVDSAADSRYVYPRLRFLARSGIQVVLAVGQGTACQPGMKAKKWFLPGNHVNYSGDNPLVGVADTGSESPFFEVKRPYHSVLRRMFREMFRSSGIPAGEGVLAGCGFGKTIGPIRMRALGCAVASPMILPEALCAARLGIRFGAIASLNHPSVAEARELATIIGGIVPLVEQALAAKAL